MSVERNLFLCLIGLCLGGNILSPALIRGRVFYEVQWWVIVIRVKQDDVILALFVQVNVKSRGKDGDLHFFAHVSVIGPASNLAVLLTELALEILQLTHLARH